MKKALLAMLLLSCSLLMAQAVPASTQIHDLANKWWMADEQLLDQFHTQKLSATDFDAKRKALGDQYRPQIKAAVANTKVTSGGDPDKDAELERFKTGNIGTYRQVRAMARYLAEHGQ